MATIVDSLREHAQRREIARAFVFVEGSGDTPVTYTELDAAARTVAAALTERGAAGRPVLLLYPPGRAYVEGFLGCLYAGAIAVPAYPPDPTRLARTLPRLHALVADSGAELALTLSWIAPLLTLPGVRPLATDELPARAWDGPPPAADDVAMIQYTSGSTGTPRGVVLSHANLVHNAELVRLGFGSSSEEIGVSWLPPYHDMGLIGGILQPIYAGMTTVLMSPLDFLQRPALWLETVSRFGATMSGGPNFAFDLCVRKVAPDGLDLSRWAVAFTGAEPVRAATLDRFAEAFAPAGFRREAFYPCYGLAEATLIVTGGRRGAGPRPVGAHVGCGSALGDQSVAVVSPDTGTECPAGVVGEIRVRGASVARGYWNRPRESADTFANGWLRTGDLGLLDGSGELVVTGRVKDVIILRGRNVYPQDLEHAVEQGVPAVRPGCAAAFAVDRDGAERVAFACEVTDASGAGARAGGTAGGTGGTAASGAVAGTGGPGAVAAAVRQVLAEEAEVSPAVVVLLRPRTIPKTTSGKIRRGACRDALTSGEWTPDHPDVVAVWAEPAPDGPPAAAGGIRVTAGAEGRRGDGSGGGDLAGVVAEVLRVGAAVVATDEPLTRLGLDSLRAVELRHALEERLGLDVPVSALLGGATLTSLADAPAARPRGAEVPSSAVNPGQRALWFLQRWAPDSTAYVITRAARVRSTLDADALARAFTELVARHPALRTSLPAEHGEPVARVTTALPALVRHDASGLDDGALRRLVAERAGERFDLERGPLCRAELFSRADDDHVLLLSVHHAVSDFWSMSVLVQELLALYRGGPLPPPGVPAAGADPVGADLDRRLKHWRETLADAPAALELPTSFPRPRVQSFRGGTHAFRVDAPTLAALDGFAAETGTTRFVVLAATFAALLARYTGEDVVLGTPTAGRDDRRDARVLGYLVNPVPLRIRVPTGTTLRALVGEVRATLLAALDNAVPFPVLVEALRPARDPGRSPVVQTMLTLQQPPPGRPDLGAFVVADESVTTDLAGLRVSPYGTGVDGSAFDVSLVLAEVSGTLAGRVEYCADLFDADAAARLADRFTTLLTTALTPPPAATPAATPATGLGAGPTGPDVALDALALMGDGERAEVMGLAHGGPAAPDTLTALFARQVARRPHAEAVVGVDGVTVLDYTELDRRARRLAGVLRGSFGVRRGDLVGVCLPRHEDSAVAFWAVLLAGGALLPLEPELPPNRLAWMVRDARPVVIVTHDALVTRLPSPGPPLLRHDTPSDVSGVSGPADGIGDASAGRHGYEELGPDDLAYVLYTSGSTGRPKGVLVPHRGASTVPRAEAAALGMTEDDRVLQYASCAYDVSVDEILMAHLHGATLVITPPPATVPGPELVRVLHERRITVLAVSPSALGALPDAELPHLRRLLLGGEECPSELVARWSPGRCFVNAYGPTETTICATLDECVADGNRPPIGRPLPGTRTHVLDGRLEPVPVGVPGELFVGGDGLARGYLGRPGLTAERFVADPFGGGGRLYRTGDRVRLLPDGRLDFLGRLDDQVQVRGARVEPGEVRALLLELSAAREAAVLPRPAPGGGVELVAYLVVPADRRPTVAELRARLRAELPGPWVPSAFVFLDALPLNTSHKLDRSALPAPTPADRGVSGRVAPRTDLERAIAQVWASVLDTGEVGVRDHFFDELGGSSLLVTMVTSRLAERLGVDVPVTHLFEYPTVEALARQLGSAPVPVTDTARDQALTRREALARRRRRGSDGS